ncbi:MAG: hypothetical protein JWO96_272 [Candidatus Saccharibacteria bacterium]|nr:hypothetical protein [Candidatus Saccharibacteria bacterium]
MDKKDTNRARTRTAAAPRKRPPTSNYYRSGAGSVGEGSPFEQKVKTVNKLSKFWVRTLDVLLVLLLLYLLIHSLILKPKARVVVNDTSYHSMVNYQDSINNYLGALRNHNKITFSENGVVNALKRDYPEITAAAVELPVFSQSPVVRLQIAAPSFFLSSADKEYLVDASGRAVAYASQYPLVKNLPQIIDQSGYEVSRGKQVLSSRDVSFIKNLVEHSNSSGIKLQSLILPSSPEELDLRAADKSYFVKFYLGGDSDLQIGQFLASRHEFAQKGTNPEQYLDVRVSGKIFYK